MMTQSTLMYCEGLYITRSLLILSLCLSVCLSVFVTVTAVEDSDANKSVLTKAKAETC